MVSTIHVEKFRLSRRTLLARIAVALTAMGWAPSVAARTGQKPAVELGKVKVRVARREAELGKTLRRTLEARLARLELPATKRPQRYLLDASLMRLSTQRSGRDLETTCVVSATLRKADGGALHAILRGRATAAASSGAVEANEDHALKAAVKSVLRRVPDAVER